MDRAAGGTGVGLAIRAGWRFNRHFSLLGAVAYDVMVGGMAGLRYAIALEPTWHPVDGLSIGLGLGYAGIVGETNDYDYGGSSEPFPPTAAPEPHDPLDNVTLRECSGGGVVGHLRLGYLFRLGRVASTGPAATFFVQGSRCAGEVWDYQRLVDRDVVQWWSHAGLSLGWNFVWR